MEDTRVSDLSPIEELPNISEIYLSRSRVDDLSSLAKLPAVLRGQPVKFGIKNLPALEKDPRLSLLARLGGDQASAEIIQYLNGNHPAFSNLDKSGQRSVTERLARASPVKFAVIDGMIEAFNQDDFPVFEINNREAKLGAIRYHVQDLIEESRLKQVPEDLIRRLSRYKERADLDDPLFLSLDAAMSFIRGALADKYFLEATDGGYVAACDLLVKSHDNLRSSYVRDDLELNDFVAEMSDDIDANVLQSIVGSTVSAVSNSAISSDIGTSVIQAMESLRGYVEAAQADRNNPNLVKKGLIAVSSTIAALSAVASIHLWAISEAGSAFLGSMRSLLQGILRLLNLT